MTSPLARAMAVALALEVYVCAACAPPNQRKPVEMAPIGTVPILVRTPEEPDGGTTTTPNSGTTLTLREVTCTGGKFDALDETLRKCDSAMPRTSEVPGGMRDKLDVRLATSKSSIAPGGRVELTLSMKNRSIGPLQLYFTGEPEPRFEVEALDARGKRADLPSGKPPKTPALPPRDARASRITLAPGGTARVKVPWDAVKTRWAPERVMMGWEGRGYPRAPAGPIAAGRYTLRMVLPLVGEVDLPKIAVAVGGS